MKSVTMLLVIAVTALMVFAEPPTFPEGATLRVKIAITREHLRCPGIAVAVHEGGKPLLVEAFGVADLQTGAALTLDHHQRIGSVAKPFVGVVALQLVEEGELSLNDPISKYVEGVPNGDGITIRMLGDQSSGLFNYIASPDVKAKFAAEPARQWTDRELLALSYAQGPHFEPPGSDWVYSNTNTILLAMAIEKAGGEPIGHQISNRILKPLRMSHTHYSVESAMPEPFARGYQYGTKDGPIYWKGQGEVAHDVTTDSPSKWGAAGAMISTVPDLVVFNRALAKGELLSPAMQAELTRWRETGYPSKYAYEYGFCLMRYHGMQGHTGYVPGFQSVMTYDPQRDLSIVVLANCYSSPNWEEPASAIYYVVMRHLTGRSYSPWDGW